MVLFSTALTDETYNGTYDWLKNNKELINVAVSRAKDRLVVLSSMKNLNRLHRQGERDDLYDLIQYVRTNGASQVIPQMAYSRALGIKPFSVETEEAFLTSLNHALGNIWTSENRYSVERGMAVSQVFPEGAGGDELFDTGKFDFVVCENRGEGRCPVLAIEMSGRERSESGAAKARNGKKAELCRVHGMELIWVENSYARRYQYIKGILETYFAARH